MADNFYKIKRGANLAPQGSVSNPADGDIYYDSTKNSFTMRNNGKWVDVQRRSDVATAANLSSSEFTSSVVEASVVKLTGSTASNIHGLTASSDAKVIYLYNGSSAVITLKDNSVSESTAANRISTPFGSDIVLTIGQSIVMTYDSFQSRWAALSAPSGGSSTALQLQVFDWKKAISVVVASTANVTLASGAQNGSVINGITLVTNDLILLKNQTDPSENGVYVVQATGAPVRDTSADTFDELNRYVAYAVFGTTLPRTAWFQTATLSDLSDPQTWSNTIPVENFTAQTENLIILASPGGGGAGGGGFVRESGSGASDYGGGGGGAGSGCKPLTFIKQTVIGETITVTLGLGGAGGKRGDTAGQASAGLAGSSTIISALTSGWSITIPGGAGGAKGQSTGGGGAEQGAGAVGIGGLGGVSTALVDVIYTFGGNGGNGGPGQNSPANNTVPTVGQSLVDASAGAIVTTLSGGRGGAGGSGGAGVDNGGDGAVGSIISGGITTAVSGSHGSRSSGGGGGGAAGSKNGGAVGSRSIGGSGGRGGDGYCKFVF